MASTARLDELKKKFDENPRRYFAPLANEHRKSGDPDQAIALCRAHLPQQPAHISGHIVLGQALFEAGQLDESRETFHTALELDPENLIALRYLGDVARSGGDVSTARSWYQRVLEVDPRNDEIVQLIRDLDAPAGAEEPTAAADVAVAEPEPIASVPVAGVPATPSPAVVDQSRFAPLTIDQIDSDTELFAPSRGESTDSGSSSGHEQSLDVGAAWGSDASTLEMPLLDVPELDPYDTSAAASAEALLEGTTTAADQGGSFLDDLTPNEPVDVGALDAEPHAARDAWAGREPAAAESQAVESPSAPSTPEQAPSAAEFEEGAFYLEPAPASASEWSEPETNVEPPVETPYAGAAAANAPSPSFDEAAPASEVGGWHPEPAPPVAAEAPNVAASAADAGAVDVSSESAEVVAHETVDVVADTVKAAPAGVAPPVDGGLGLEVMEFVPPSASSQPAITPMLPEADPLVGHMPELTSPATGATPDGFVTETMAELYLQQGFTNEALAVYRELLARNPSDSSLRERIDQIESGSMSSIGMATLSANIVESARKRQTERPARSVRSFFASFAARRAPFVPPRESEPTSYYPSETQPETESTASGWAADASATEQVESEPLSEAEAPNVVPHTPSTNPPASPASMSAAEQMATFDPFGDAWDAPPATGGSMPNDAGSSGTAAAPSSFESSSSDLDPSASAPPQPEAIPAPDPQRPAPRSLQDIFPDSSATPRADAAAETLATAFGRSEPQGRPTRAATNELSLDRVFRGAPEGAPQADGGFSFDQFFSDARAAANDATAPPLASNAPEVARGTEASGDAHDIEQFTAWLEGLKKK